VRSIKNKNQNPFNPALIEYPEGFNKEGSVRPGGELSKVHKSGLTSKEGNQSSLAGSQPIDNLIGTVDWQTNNYSDIKTLIRCVE
jgi:hypothetical protein